MNFQVQNSEVWHEAKIWISGNCSKNSPFISRCLQSPNHLGLSPAIQKSDQLKSDQSDQLTKSKKIGCEIANNRISLHFSRKTKTTEKIKSVEEIYFHGYCNRNKPISSRFFGCEFDPFHNRIGSVKKKNWNRNKPNRSFFDLEFRCIWLV